MATNTYPNTSTDFDLASLIELGDPTARAEEEPTAPNAVVPADYGTDEEHTTMSAMPVSTWTEQVSAGQAVIDLVAREEQALAAAGLDVATADKSDRLLYERGTALADIGHQNLTSYERAYQEMPSPTDAVAAFLDEVSGEDRDDRVVDLTKYRLNHDGRLAHVSTPDSPGLAIGRTPWRQLAEIAGSQNLNRGLSERKRADRKVRSRSDGRGGRETFAVVSPEGYTVLDGPQVADLLLRGLRDRGLESGAKMEITYDAGTTRYQARAIVQAPIDIPALWGVGRVHQAFVQVSGGDDGMTSLRGQGGALRIRCLNASLAQVNGLEWTRAHKGKLTEIRALVAGMVDQFGTLAESLRTVWSEAAAHHYLDTDGTQLSVHEAITRLVAHDHIPTGGLDAAQAVDRYMDAWRAEDSPTSAAGILMAVQRAAHEGAWRTKWDTTEIEASASALLYQNVYTLAEVNA
jgi:hypothetical protein